MNSRNKDASHSLLREFKDKQERKLSDKIHINKKSIKLAEKALKNKVQSVVLSLSQNGYLAFEHFWNVLYMLRITQSIGKPIDNTINSARVNKIKENRDSIELEFTLQLWNKINWYLFNYVDSVILIDFLVILLSNSPNKIITGEQYIIEISQADNLPIEEIERNKERNAQLIPYSLWTMKELFEFYKEKLNWPSIVSRNGPTINDSIK